MLRLAGLLLVVLLASAGLACIETIWTSLGQLVERNFVALTLVALLPALMPWME